MKAYELNINYWNSIKKPLKLLTSTYDIMSKVMSVFTHIGMGHDAEYKLNGVRSVTMSSSPIETRSKSIIESEYDIYIQTVWELNITTGDIQIADMGFVPASTVYELGYNWEICKLHKNGKVRLNQYTSVDYHSKPKSFKFMSELYLAIQTNYTELLDSTPFKRTLMCDTYINQLLNTQQQTQQEEEECECRIY